MSEAEFEPVPLSHSSDIQPFSAYLYFKLKSNNALAESYFNLIHFGVEFYFKLRVTWHYI